MAQQGGIKAYKLLRKRADGSLGPLFINARQRIPLGKWLQAENHPTKGFKVRPGWHAVHAPDAPHLSKKGRVWCEVSLKDFRAEPRGFRQGGVWFVAQQMKVISEV